MQDQVHCNACKAIIESSRADISIKLTDNCDKCKQKHVRVADFHFCCNDCLIEFINKNLAWRVIRLRDGK